MARSGICSLSAIRNRFAKYFEEVSWVGTYVFSGIVYSSANEKGTHRWGSVVHFFLCSGICAIQTFRVLDSEYNELSCRLSCKIRFSGGQSYSREV